MWGNIMTSIVLVDSENAIGKNNKLLVHITEDMKRFKEITEGNVVVMGRKTWDSLTNKPLKNRLNCIISTQLDIQEENVKVFRSVEDCIKFLNNIDKDVYIIGGGEIYHQFMPYCNKLLITRVKYNYNGTVYFPSISFEEWRLKSKSNTKREENVEYNYETWERIRE